FVRRDDTFRTLVEPIVSVTAAPNLGDQRHFPNEDSRGIDLDDTNLFRPNRFAAYDRLEGGQRVTYGLNADVARLTGGRATAFLGQSYRLKRESAFTVGSGLQDQSSNIVGRITLSPHEWFSASYRFQLDKDDLSAQRNFTGVTVGPRPLRLSVGYTFLERTTQTNLPFDLEQISTQLDAQLTNNWRFRARSLNSIGADRGQLLAGGSVFYEDECLLFGFDLTRRNIGNRDNPPDTSFVVRVVLRNLGEIKSNIF
ncbi:MAG: LPS assembly protein LptD, partial [Rhodospirillales bacterium]|nr:LPS assembly protein LptD [Rhodospirillales bacterium]